MIIFLGRTIQIIIKEIQLDSTLKILVKGLTKKVLPLKISKPVVSKFRNKIKIKKQKNFWNWIIDSDEKSVMNISVKLCFNSFSLALQQSLFLILLCQTKSENYFIARVLIASFYGSTKKYNCIAREKIQSNQRKVFFFKMS